MIEDFNPDLVIAGPAFNAGRYGMACGTVGKIAHDMGIPAVSGMYIENPGVEAYRQYLYIVETTNSAAGMRTALPAIAKLAGKIVNGEPVGTPAEEGYISRGIRKNIFVEKRGSERAVDMLLKKGKNLKPISHSHLSTVRTCRSHCDLSNVTVNLVTSGESCPRQPPTG